MNNKNKHILALLVDSEYISSRYQQPISLFVKILLIEIDSRSHIYKKKLELFKQCYVFKNVLEKETFLDPNLFYIVEKPEEIFNDLYPYLKNKKELLEYEQKIKLKIECWYYYAPLDWQLTFWEFRKEIIQNSLKRAVSSHRVVTFRELKIKIKDLSHVGGIGSLSWKLSWMGAKKNEEEKQLGNKMKTQMHKFLNENPQEFYRYSENDVEALHIILFNTQKFFNYLYNKMKLSKKKMHLTTGSNVQELLQSIVNKKLKHYRILPKEWKENKLHNSLRKIDKSIKIKKLSHVVGGRCNNENPDEFFYKNMNDVDIKACYTFAMSTLLLPIAKFRILFNMKISDFLQTPKLSTYWALSFSTKNSFSQDLIGSLILVEESSDKTDNFDYQNIDETFANKKIKESIYLKREIVDGVLTHKTLETMRRYYKEEQVNEILNCNASEIFYYQEEDLKEHIELKTVLSELQKIKEKKKGGISQMAKLFLNATYGTLCSRYMEISNVLVAQMITAIARSWIYIIHKELQSPVSITDGTFTHLDKQTIYQKLKNEEFQVTIKHSEPLKQIVIFGKSNYFFNQTFKLRGIKETKGTPHELFYKKILPAIAQQQTPPFLETRMTIQHHIYSLSAYKNEQKLKGFLLQKVIPLGYTRPHIKTLTITNGHASFDYLADYKKNKRMYNKRKISIIPTTKGLPKDIINWANTMSDSQNLEIKSKISYYRAEFKLSKIIFDEIQLMNHDETDKSMVGILRNIYIPSYQPNMVLIQNTHGLIEKYKDEQNIEVYRARIHIYDFPMGSFESYITEQINQILSNLDKLTFSIEISYSSRISIEKLRNIEATINLLRNEFFQILKNEPTEILKITYNIDKNIPYI